MLDPNSCLHCVIGEAIADWLEARRDTDQPRELSVVVDALAQVAAEVVLMGQGDPADIRARLVEAIDACVAGVRETTH